MFRLTTVAQTWNTQGVKVEMVGWMNTPSEVGKFREKRLPPVRRRLCFYLRIVRLEAGGDAPACSQLGSVLIDQFYTVPDDGSCDVAYYEYHDLMRSLMLVLLIESIG